MTTSYLTLDARRVFILPKQHRAPDALAVEFSMNYVENAKWLCNMKTDRKSLPDDALEVYRENVTVITEIKRAQWQVTNYIILVFAGILALRTDIGRALPDYMQPHLGISMPLILWLLGTTVLIKQYLGLRRRRIRMKRNRTLLSEEARKLAGGVDNDGTHGTVWSTDLLILLVCLGVTLAGAALCSLLLGAT